MCSYDGYQRTSGKIKVGHKIAGNIPKKWGLAALLSTLTLNYQQYSLEIRSAPGSQGHCPVSHLSPEHSSQVPSAKSGSGGVPKETMPRFLCPGDGDETSPA